MLSRDALLRTLTSLGTSPRSLVTHALFNVPVEMTVFMILDAVTAAFKLNSEFQWEERESSIIFFNIVTCFEMRLLKYYLG